MFLKNFKRSKLLLGLLPILSMIFYILTANHDIFADQAYVSVDIHATINDTLTPDAGTTPDDYDARENFAIAAGVILSLPNHSTTLDGVVKAMGTDQMMGGHKVVIGDKVYWQTTSISELTAIIAPIAHIKYSANGHIIMRTGTYKSGDISWNGTVKEISESSFARHYGVIPREITKYSVTESSYVSGELVSKEGDLYTYKMKLIGALAQQYSMREMMTFAGVDKEPSFQACEITYTIDKNWKVREIKYYDKYELSLMGGVVCTSNMTETFYYDETEFPEIAKPLIEFVPVGPAEDIEIEKGPADYLSAAFADYISGDKQINLSANVNATLGDKPLNLDLKAQIDISNLKIKLALGELVYLSYDDSGVKFKLGETSGAITSSDLNEFLSSLGVDLSSALSGLDTTALLGTLFENTVISETDTAVVIPMQFNLAGIDFNVDMNLLKVGDTVTADTILAKIDLSQLLGSDVTVNANVELVDDIQITEPVAEYPSYKPMLDTVSSMISAKSYTANGDVTITNSNFESETILLKNLVIDRGEKISVSGTITASDAELDFTLYDDVFYLQIGEIKLKASANDISEIIDAVKPLISSSEENLTTVIAKIISNVDFSKITDYLKGLVVSPNGIQYNLKTDSGEIALNVLALNNEITLTTNDISLGDVKLTANAKIVANQNNVTVSPVLDDSFVSVSSFTQFIPAIEKLLKAKTFAINLYCEEINTAITNGTLNGLALISIDEGYVNVEANVSFREHKLDLIYLGKSQEIFVRFNEIYLSFAISDINEIANSVTSQQADVMQLAVSTVGIIESAVGMSLGDLIKIVNGFSYDANLNCINLTASIDDLNASISVGVAQDEKIYLNVNSLNFRDILSINSLSATLNHSPIATEITIDEDERQKYFAIKTLLPILSAKSYSGNFNVTITDKVGNYENIVVNNVRINRGETLTIDGSIQINNVTLSFIYLNDTFYIAVGNVYLKADKTDLNEVIDVILPLLEIEEPNTNTTDVLTTIIDAINEIGFENIENYISGLKIDNSGITYSIDLANAKIDLAISVSDSEINVSKGDVKVNDVSVSLGGKISANTQNVDITLNGYTESEFVSIGKLAKFISPVLDVINNKTFIIDIEPSTLNSAFISGEYSGKLIISLNEQNVISVAGTLKLRDHEISVYYFGANDELFIRINEIYVSLKLSDINDIKEIIEKYTNPDAPTPLLETVVNTSGIIYSTLGMNLDELINIVRSITYDDESDALKLTAEYSGVYADLSLSLNQNQNLTLLLSGIDFDGIIYNSTLKATLTSQAEETTVSLSTDEKAKYLKLSDVATFIDPIMQTTTKDHFAISFDGSVVATDKTTSITGGELNIELTQKFANVYASFTLSDGKSQHAIKAYIIDDRKFNGNELISGDINAYVNYNEFKVKVDYTSVLRMLGAVCDVIGLDIPILNDLIAEVYTEELDTSVFETLNLGLDSIGDAIDDISGGAEDQINAANEGILALLAFVDADMIDSLLKGITLSHEVTANGGKLNVNIDNGIFTAVNKGKISTVSIAHNQNTLSAMSIQNLIVNGDKVNFTASLSHEEFDLTAPESANTYYDLGYVDDLLISLINTAAVREYEISGAINLNVLIINVEIPLNIKIKLMPDGSVRAAAELNVPFKLLGALIKTNSYVYLVNGRLYFVVDVWEPSGLLVKLNEGSYDRTEVKSATLDEFLANPFDYLFFLLRMSDTIKDPILNAINAGSSGEPSSDVNEIIKNFYCDTSRLDLTLGLAELSGNGDLDDLKATINMTDKFITSLSASLSFVSIVDLSLNATLTNVYDGNAVRPTPSALSGVSLGKSYSATTIDELDNTLATIFPVESASDTAKIGEGYLTRANERHDYVKQLNEKITETQNEIDLLAKELDEAKRKLAETPEGTFGYTRAESIVTATQNSYDTAVENLQKYQVRRVDALNDSLTATNRVIEIIEKLSSRASLAITQSSTDAYESASYSALIALSSFETAQTILNETISIANEIGEQDVSSTAQQMLTSLNSQKSQIGYEVYDTTLISFDKVNQSVIDASNSAITAKNNGDFSMASTYAQNAIDSINALNICDIALTLSASYTSNDSYVQTALERSAIAKNTISSNCELVAGVATWSADSFANSIVTTSLDILNNSSTRDVGTIINDIFNLNNNIDKALSTVDTANSALTIISNQTLEQELTVVKDKLTASIDTASGNVISAIPNIAKRVYDITLSFVGSATTIANFETTVNTANYVTDLYELFNTASNFHDNSANDSYRIKLNEYAVQMLNQVLPSLAKQSPAISSQLTSGVDSAVSTANSADRTGFLVYKYEKFGSAADTVTARANEITQLSTSINNLTQLANLIYIINAESENASEMLNSINAIVYDNALESAVTTLQTLSQKLVNSADTLKTNISKYSSGLLDDYNDNMTKVSTATSATATTNANVTMSYNGLGLLISHL